MAGRGRVFKNFYNFTPINTGFNFNGSTGQISAPFIGPTLNAIGMQDRRNATRQPQQHPGGRGRVD
jgi:hypothetical protein